MNPCYNKGMQFRYIAIEQSSGQERRGEVDAASKDLAIAALQRRGLVVMNVSEVGVQPAWMKKDLLLRGARQI